MQDKEPLISIITITYNAERGLPATLRSLREQTYKDFEHIIIDGASQDDTLTIARKDGVTGARLLSEPDKGLYYAMNKGLEMAHGKYVLFLNAGDSFHSPETLMRYAEAAQEDPDIIYSDTVIVDADRREIRPRHLSVPERLTFKSFKNGMLVCHQAFMVRKAIAPLYDTSYRFSADYDWTVKCIEKTMPERCVNLHITGIDYLDAGTTEKNKIKSLIERYEIMSRHYGVISTAAHHLMFITRALRRNMSR